MSARALPLNLVFFASGFAGLIYESIWTHYLKLFLGHAAYAQTLVLGIFMGGMAIGAGIAARYSRGIANPLRAYAGIEIAIGVLGLAFHWAFNASVEAYYVIALAGEPGSPLMVGGRWVLAALLILPQSVLLGATFPLFAAAATRGMAAAGRPVATLYFANSLGGALGVVASGFFLIPAIGLPGTIVAAGTVNLAIGLLVGRAATGPVSDSRYPASAAALSTSFGRIPRLLVAVSFLTGASSFIYEVGWIRMLSLVLGSATHSFELMLCAFIVGLALGGLWIRKRIDCPGNHGVTLGYVQVAMGCAAILTIPLHNLTFDLVGWVIGHAPKSEVGYSLLNLVRYGIASLIMFPAAFCAGMTLPLATRLLHTDSGQGERAIGIIYSANTVGAIAGLSFAVHIGFAWLGLEYLVAFGALIDVALGIAVLLAFGGAAKARLSLVALATCFAGAAIAATTFNPQKLVSGVFRTGEARLKADVVEIAHGRTATISVDRNGPTIAIRTNGKPDASAQPLSPAAYEMDEVTMNLIGVVPLMLHPEPRRVANIGFGSGITGAAILTDPRVERLDTIEIEPRMVDLARRFAGLNDAVYVDPRSKVHIDDARAFFAAHGQVYDVIVSEPSNPWVSGVSGLFSREFYQHVTRYLKDDGLFAQWLQVYETHPDRITSIMKAMDAVFDDYLLVALNYGDVLLIARPRGQVRLPADAFARLDLATKARLRRLEIANQTDLSLRIIGGKTMFRPWLDSRPIPANSDFHPYLDSHADFDRFIGGGWTDLPGLALTPYPLAAVFGHRPPYPPGELPSVNRHFGNEPAVLAARLTVAQLAPRDNADTLPISPALPQSLVQQGLRPLTDCRNPPLGDKPFALAAFGIRVTPYLPASDGEALLSAARSLPCFDGLPRAQATWPLLLDRAAAGDPGGYGSAAERLLQDGQGATEVRRRYLVGMAALGLIGAGDRERARRVWSAHGGASRDGKPAGLALEILEQQLAAPEIRPAADLRRR